MNKRHIKSIFQFVIFFSTLQFYVFAQDIALLQERFTLATEYQSEQKDSSIIELQKLIPLYKQQNDTAMVIACRRRLVAIYSGMAEFSKAYQEVWKILPLCESSNFVEDKIETINRLIGLFLLYDQYDKAIDWHNQLTELVENSNISSKKKTYYKGRVYSLGSWIEIRGKQNYTLAEQLTTKAIEQYQKLGDEKKMAIHHTKIQLANVYMRKGQLNKAFAIFKEEMDLYPPPLKPLHALLYFRLGEYYTLKDNQDSTEHYYKQSLKVITQFNTLSDKKPLILNALSKINAKNGNYHLAYEQNKEAALLNELYYSSQQSQNRQLFEIKDQYQEQLKEQEAQIKEQQLSILTKENLLLKLRAFSIVLCLLIVAFLAVIIIRRKSKKKLLTQTLINEKQKLALKKQEEVLEIKNKELLSSAMQLLERENEQAEIKKQLDKLTVKDKDALLVQQLKNDLKINKTQKWKEFESRFTTVNNDFFSRLKEKYPLLTPTDLKMCAFIKLGFSSKDMAQIMGITVEGINTTRSRLRKKMNLSREVVLAEFLQALK